MMSRRLVTWIRLWSRLVNPTTRRLSERPSCLTTHGTHSSIWNLWPRSSSTRTAKLRIKSRCKRIRSAELNPRSNRSRRRRKLFKRRGRRFSTQSQLRTRLSKCKQIIWALKKIRRRELTTRGWPRSWLKTRSTPNHNPSLMVAPESHLWSSSRSRRSKKSSTRSCKPQFQEYKTSSSKKTLSRWTQKKQGKPRKRKLKSRPRGRLRLKGRQLRKRRRRNNRKKQVRRRKSLNQLRRRWSVKRPRLWLRSRRNRKSSIEILLKVLPRVLKKWPQLKERPNLTPSNRLLQPRLRSRRPRKLKKKKV